MAICLREIGGGIMVMELFLTCIKTTNFLYSSESSKFCFFHLILIQNFFTCKINFWKLFNFEKFVVFMEVKIFHEIFFDHLFAIFYAILK
jgi:hypothetical protein